MELKTRIYLLDDEKKKFMGAGVMWLLQKTRDCGSLRKAAQDMDISYSKAFHMIKHLEAALGKEVLVRQKGGSSREGAHLSTFGQSFLSLYESFYANVKMVVEKPYEEFCQSLSGLMED